MTAKRLNVRKVVNLKFTALPNKELRSLRHSSTIHEKMFHLHSLGTHNLRIKFHWVDAPVFNTLLVILLNLKSEINFIFYIDLA